MVHCKPINWSTVPEIAIFAKVHVGYVELDRQYLQMPAGTCLIISSWSERGCTEKKRKL